MTPGRRQQGQSLVLASLLLMVAAVVLLLMFNTAQLTRSKMELQNTADATAYSVATIAARDYNFTAYMNRAMVANQVAVAQMVGLSSWFRFTGQTLDNITAICEPIPGLDAICTTLDTTYNEFNAVFQETVIPIAVNVLNDWLAVLSNLETAFHLGNVEAIAQNLLYGGGAGLQAGVLKLNDPEASLLRWPDKSSDIPSDLYQLAILIKDAGDWWKFTSHYDGSEKDLGQGRFAEVTSNSRDDFSLERSWYLGGTVFDTDWVMDHIPSWLRDIIKALLPVHLSGSMKLGLSRKGGTELKEVNDKYSWSAADTLMGDGEATIDVEYPCGVKWCCWHHICVPCGIEYCSVDFHQHVDLPFGWGASYSTASDDETPGEEIYQSELDDDQYGGAAAGPARPTFELAVGEYGDAPVTNFGGLRPYYDISKPTDPSTRNNDGPQFTIVVGKNLDKIRTASRAGFGAPDGDCDAGAGKCGPFGMERLRLDEPSDIDSFYAISKGRLRFARSGQYSNLFGPYWEAKLADTTDQERLLAYETLFGWKDLINNPLGSAGDLSGLGTYAP
jgi:hypothetical protein